MHQHHLARNLGALSLAVAAAIVYTVVADSRGKFKNHDPIEIPDWLHSPGFRPVVVTPIKTGGDESLYDYDRFDTRMPTW